MILIIDDDSAIRSSLSFMLKRAGYDVQAVPGPREAIDTVRTQAPDLILMDMNFTLSTTGEEGLTLLRQVKVFRPEVPVILMTAWGSIQLAVQGMQAGAFDFVTKPWNNAALLQRIETALALTAPPVQDKTDGTPVLNRSHIIGKSRGLTDVRIVMWYAFISYFIVSLPVSYCFAFLFDWGLPGIWFSYPVGLTCAGLLYSSRFFRRTRA